MAKRSFFKDVLTHKSMKRLGFCLALSCSVVSNLAVAQNSVTANKTPNLSSISSKPDASPAGAKLNAENTLAFQIAGDLVKAGTLNLALKYLASKQPPINAAKARRAWAEQKWRIMILRQDWQALKKDSAAFAQESAAAKTFSASYQARALIGFGELSAAEGLLRAAIPLTASSKPLNKKIREQLIALYQAQGDYTNAKIEAIRFHDEFKPQKAQWFIKRATIEFLAGDAKGAAQLLAPLASLEARLLQAYFRLSGHELTLEKTLAQIKQQLARKRITAKQKKLAYSLLVKSHQNQANTTAYTLASLSAMVLNLEKYIVIKNEDAYPLIVKFSADDLKTAYYALADKLINLSLQDPGRASLKYTLAQNIQAHSQTLSQTLSENLGESRPENARALYVDVMLDKNEKTLGIAAKNELLAMLIEAKQYSLITALFDDENSFGDFSEIRSGHSANILNYALAKGDADLIAQIAPFLNAAPDQIDEKDWLLQKARIDIFSGRFKQGKRNILMWLAQSDVLTGAEVDRVLQPVYDLQAVHQNDLSISLFNEISNQTNSKRHKREILFWKAQSFEDKGERMTAAALYLRSALAQDNGFDDWGHSARYHAASNLMEAQSYEDARALFDGLLKATIDPDRRATIKQSLQRLWLLQTQGIQ